jgi:hypothetical protein
MKGLQRTEAFVVQFRRPLAAREDQLPGRVEHVSSGRTATFQSLDELPHLLRKLLSSVPANEGNGT